MATPSNIVDRVRIRPGPGPRAAARARRLARIAHRHLGPALDRALADVDDDLTIELVTVTFPADPDELDDQAVAMLWAALIRDSVEALRGNATPPSTPTVGDPADRDLGPPGAVSAAAADLAGLVGVLQRWVRDGTPPSRAQVRLALHQPDLADRALAQLAEPWRSLTREMLGRAAVSASEREPDEPRFTDTPPAAPAGPPGDRAAGIATSPSEPKQADRVRRGRIVTADRNGVTGPQPAARHTLTTPVPVPVPMSDWGGLVLLHHRLRAYLTRAEKGAPDLDPIAVRVAALAGVVDDPMAVADPLVRLLAGVPDWPVPVDRAGVVHPDVDHGDVDRILREFAGDLPGFGGSSASFVREQWLRRRALLLEDAAAVRLTLQRRPLDLVLDRIPYPIGALRLPWTPPMFVGWERP